MPDRRNPPIKPNLELELRLWQQGYRRLAGLDEAGRGAWAGPLVAAAVVLPAGLPDLPDRLREVRDSKTMRPAERRHWSAVIHAQADEVAIGVVSSLEVDQLGILTATRLAMTRALSTPGVHPDHLLIDYISLPDVDLPQVALPRGDARLLSIAAASVIAKTARDAMMIEFDRRYPGYGFEHHKGYGTPQHRRALQRLGPCPIHRLTFRPVASTALPWPG
jgi:ribonuclease HII